MSAEDRSSACRRAGRAEVAIITVPAIHLAVMEHHSDPSLIGETIHGFTAWRKKVRDAGTDLFLPLP